MDAHRTQVCLDGSGPALMISQSSAVAERGVPNLRCRIYLIIRGGRAAMCGTLLRKTAPQSVTAGRGQQGGVESADR